MKRPSKAFGITLSAVACAVATVALISGSYFDFLLGAAYILACFSIMVPLSKGYVGGAALCYLGAGLLSLFFALWKIVPYAVFFGLHPIVNYLQKVLVKKTPLKAVCLLVKTIWFDFAMWLSFFVLTELVGLTFHETIMRAAYYIIFIGGTLLFPVYDVAIFLCQRSVNNIVRRIGR